MQSEFIAPRLGSISSQAHDLTDGQKRLGSFWFSQLGHIYSSLLARIPLGGQIVRAGLPGEDWLHITLS